MKILSFKKNTKFPSSLHFPVSTCNSNINPSFWKCNINDGICSEDDSTLSPFFFYSKLISFTIRDEGKEM